MKNTQVLFMLLCVIIVSGIPKIGMAQNDYHVTYLHRGYSGAQDTAFVELVFNDSAAYLYHRNTWSDFKWVYQKDDTVFGGSKAYHHNAYFNPRKNQLCDVQGLKEKKVRYYYRKPHYYQFTVQEDNLIVSGMRCMRGYAIKKSGDTIYAVISKDINYPYGPFCFNGLPGLVVEFYDAEFKYYTSMVSITRGSYKILLPEWGIKGEKF